MTVLAFDTLKFARRLQAAGMDARLAEEQAEALAEALEANLQELATKADIAVVRKDLQQLESDLRKEMLLLEQRLIIKLGGMLVVAVGVVATLVKLL
jgi:2-phosphoglycerate kinase